MAKAKKAVRKTISPATKVRTKSQIFGELAEYAGITRKHVAAVFDGLSEMIQKDLTKGPKLFTIPRLMKITVLRKKAQPARKGINPFTGQETIFKAKPARNVVKIRALKGLKDMVK